MNDINSFNNTCSCPSGCSVLSVISSIIIGVITSLLTITGVITVAPAFLWTVFGIAVVYLAVALISASFSGAGRSDGCFCRILPLFLTGILGTILASVILLAVTFPATSILGAIIAGVLLVFFSLVITSTACLIRCLSKCEND